MHQNPVDSEGPIAYRVVFILSLLNRLLQIDLVFVLLKLVKLISVKGIVDVGASVSTYGYDSVVEFFSNLQRLLVDHLDSLKL